MATDSRGLGKGLAESPRAGPRSDPSWTPPNPETGGGTGPPGRAVGPDPPSTRNPRTRGPGPGRRRRTFYGVWGRDAQSRGALGAKARAPPGRGAAGGEAVRGRETQVSPPGPPGDIPGRSGFGPTPRFSETQKKKKETTTRRCVSNPPTRGEPPLGFVLPFKTPPGASNVREDGRGGGGPCDLSQDGYG